MSVGEYVEKVQVGGDGSFLYGNDPDALYEGGITKWSGGELPTFVNITTTRHHNKLKRKTYTWQKVTQHISTFNVDAFLDAGESFGLIRPGTILKNVNLLSSGDPEDYEDGSSVEPEGIRFFLPFAIVKTAPHDTGGIGGVAAFRFSFDSQGDYDVFWNGTSLDMIFTPPGP